MSITVRRQCSARVDGRRCELMTRRGYLCYDHAEQLLGVRVDTSTLGDQPGDAGLGLFTTVPRRKNEKIVQYMGEILSRQDYERRPSQYAIDISQGRVIDAVKSDSCFARYANDAGTERANNCLLISDRQYGLNFATPRYSDGVGWRVFLVAKRAIQAGTELCAPYGHQYWSFH